AAVQDQEHRDQQRGADELRQVERLVETIGRRRRGDKGRGHRVSHFRDRRQGGRRARQRAVIEEQREESRNQRYSQKRKGVSSLVMAEARQAVLDEHNKDEDRKRQR